jgi:hypothetical protein
MFAQLFEFIVTTLTESGVDAGTVEIVEKVFDFIVSLFVA